MASTSSWPGSDPIAPVYPSGKNIHALDPQAIPTRAAVAAAKGVVDELIERQREEQGTWLKPSLRALGHRQHRPSASRWLDPLVCRRETDARLRQSRQQA